MAENKISDVINLDTLLKMNLKIPEYQRPYRWDIEQVKNLLSDIWENKKYREDVPYMIGTIILHFDSDKDELNIVDGQQRLTTLTLILYALGKNDAVSLLEESFSPDVVKKNYKYINYWLNKYEIERSDFKEYILGKVTFVIITTTEIDEAFVFFDSQNSRGKSLERKDLLKAHHLRYVENEKIAINSAKEWETLDKKKKLTYLIDNILGRTRQRIRKENSNSIDVLQEFKAQRVSKKKDSFYKLSKYHQPPIFDSWRYIDREALDDDDGLELVFRDIDAWQGTKRLKFVSDSKKFLPLQLMQPLEGGEQFFWYVQKYNILLNEELPKVLSESVTKIYSVIANAANWNIGMWYIKEVFEAALLFYYDKFGTDDMENFGLWLEHGLSYLRYRQSSVQYATVRNYIIREFNPFSIINEAAFPENCIYQIDDFVRGKYKDERINYEKGIRQWYHGKISTIVSNNKTLFENTKLIDKHRFDIW
ncbi:MAG: DUF262 domain-containing protein [Prevotellaceae bacterium]|jgi:hypothetical protein|nr:DUF262 domain-containing protein [Prevotellaceae bacterium]